MSESVVRAANVSDATQIYDFIVELASFENAVHEVKSSIGDIEKTLFSSYSAAHAIIEERNNIAGGMAVHFFNYSICHTFDYRNIAITKKDGLYLEDLCVSKEHRGLGIGK